MWFADYEGAGFCEVFTSDGVRPHYRRLVDRINTFDADHLEEVTRLKEFLLRRQGITFSLGSHDIDRTWPLDVVPRIIPDEEWQHLGDGLVQRVSALNQFLEDLYVGEGAIVADGIVPRWMVESSGGYLAEAYRIPVPFGVRCIVSGIDLVRDGEGTYRVLEDNLRVPSGISYVLENRAAMTRILPVAFQRYRVRSVGHYGASLLACLRSLAPAGVFDPTVVVLTPGIHNSAYFEHAFLARAMGVELVEGRDLLVDDHAVYVRTTHGLERVDVIYRRVNDEYMDPVVFRADSLLGVPGIAAAARAGTVTLANALGNGVADDKGIYPYVPEMIRYYLGAEPILPNVTTYLPWEPDQLEYVLGHLDRLVVKPVAEAGGYGIVIGGQATDEVLEATARAMAARPRDFIAQETVELSTHPTFIGNRMVSRHIDLRPFVLCGADRTEVVPGGLTRVALEEGSLIVNSSAGGGSKDTWVLDP